jgi:hypothetical protein
LTCFTSPVSAFLEINAISFFGLNGQIYVFLKDVKRLQTLDEFYCCTTSTGTARRDTTLMEYYAATARAILAIVSTNGENVARNSKSSNFSSAYKVFSQAFYFCKYTPENYFSYLRMPLNKILHLLNGSRIVKFNPPTLKVFPPLFSTS